MGQEGGDPIPERDQATLGKLGLTDDQELVLEVHILAAKPCDFAHTQAESVEQGEDGTVRQAAQGRTGPVRQTACHVQELPSLGRREQEGTPLSPSLRPWSSAQGRGVQQPLSNGPVEEPGYG
jgi:hypothetical protein